MGARSPRVGGFVLPTVVLAGIMLIVVLLAGLQLSLTVSNSLLEQHYYKLAREAAESGVARMSECLLKEEGGTVAADTAVTVLPSTNCKGVAQSGLPQYLYQDATLRTTFSGKYIAINNPRKVDVTGTVELLRKGTSSVYKTFTYSSRQQASQQENPAGTRASKHRWHFGYGARLDFGVAGNQLASPMSEAPGPQGNTAMKEGVTVMSDRYGNLLFTSDGRNIWDKNGDLVRSLPSIYDAGGGMKCGYSYMVNHDPAQPLCGSETATQAVAAFPVDKENSKYIIVQNTTNTFESGSVHAPAGYKYKGPGSLYFTMIDMKHSSAYPNGVIRYRNLPLTQKLGSAYSSEALAARMNAAGNGAVIYTYSANNPNRHNAQVYAIPIYSLNNGVHMEYDYSGHDLHPAVVDIPSEFNPNCRNDSWETGFGSITFNKARTRMLVLMGGTECPGANTPKMGGSAHLFDITGGDLSMVRLASWRIRPLINAGIEYNGSSYSADFSPSGKYVYISKIYPGQLFRYDVSSDDATRIKQSERYIARTNCGSMTMREVTPGGSATRSACIQADVAVRYGGSDGGGQVMRGPDDRMYVADYGTNHVSVVENPEASTDDLPPDPASLMGYVKGSQPPAAARVGWQYARIKLPVVPGGRVVQGAPVTFRVYYGLPQMITLYSPRLISY